MLRPDWYACLFTVYIESFDRIPVSADVFDALTIFDILQPLLLVLLDFNVIYIELCVNGPLFLVKPIPTIADTQRSSKIGQSNWVVALDADMRRVIRLTFLLYGLVLPHLNAMDFV